MSSRLQRWFGDLPGLQLVTATGCFLAVYSGIMYWVAIWREWKMEEMILAVWLGFVASLCGVAFFWFGKKRDTDLRMPSGNGAPTTVETRSEGGKVITKTVAPSEDK